MPVAHPAIPRHCLPVSACHDLADGVLDPRLVQPPVQPGFVARLGRYHIIRELGAGGMGVVFLAHDPEADSTPPRDPSLSPSRAGLVAIKVLRPELAGHPRAVKRFVSEARHLQQFDHPHIVRVHEVSLGSRRPYLVLPYFPAGSLAARLRRERPLPPAEALRLGSQIAEALAHAHAKGIIHRDLSPANVLLDASGDARLTDFGLARTVFNDSIGHVDREHHEGTLPYMSPAVARGEAEDTRCDIYGLGALLYELLSGRAPYQGRSAEDIRLQIQQGPPPRLSHLSPTLPAPLTQIVEWAMARELRHRYTQVRDLLVDLQRVAQGSEPLGPHPKARTASHRLLQTPSDWPRPKSVTTPGRAVLFLALATVALLASGFLLAVTGLIPRQPNAPAARGHPLTRPRLARPARTPTVADLNQDGRLEFLVLLPGGPDQSGSRICCFDFQEARPLWQQPLDTFADSFEVLNTDDDAFLEIVITLPAPQPDTPPLLIVLDREGTTRWMGSPTSVDMPPGLAAHWPALGGSPGRQIPGPQTSVPR